MPDIANYRLMNKLFSSGVGTQQASFLPNHRYLLRAISLYTLFLIKPGSNINAYKPGQIPLSFLATRSAAVDSV
jgi:hypothetical protein